MKQKRVDIISDHVISALGIGSDKNFEKLSENISGVAISANKDFSQDALPLGSIDNQYVYKYKERLGILDTYTRFETLCIISIHNALKQTSIDISSPETILILSTTKGNIDHIDDKTQHYKLDLWYSAKQIANFFKVKNTPRIISNSCISGVVAIIHAQRLLKEGYYKHAVVTGADILSRFIVSGFQSFMALSPEICKPFDSKRDGLTLGEGAATIIISSEARGKISIVKGSTANDANHISGPSRDGEGLYLAIKNTLGEDTNIDYISAHGTGTPYNDDMEAKAFYRSKLNNVPVNSYKGYIGHTLGAAGIIETIYSLCSMNTNKLIKTYGFKDFGVAEPINIIARNENKELNRVLKTASGFGGCNVAMLIEKNE